MTPQTLYLLRVDFKMPGTSRAQTLNSAMNFFFSFKFSSWLCDVFNGY